MDLNDLNFPYYGVTASSMSTSYDISGVQTATLQLTLYTNHKTEQMLSDIRLMEAVRKSVNVTVKDQFDQLLTTMALTNDFTGEK